MISGFVAHLWQSTLFVGSVRFLTLALRKNPARVRYSVWFIASAKFLVPFSLLVGLGSFVPWRAAAPPTETRWVAVAEQVRPLVTIPAVGEEVTLTATGANRVYFTLAAFILWFCGFAAITICWAARWMRIRELRRRATPVSIRKCIESSVPIMSVPRLVEPGVFGIHRPILLLPEGIGERLNEAQLEAILAHELCHVRRRDNLTATIHMAVQAAFWFHPLVWWLGARLVEERERACDEEVLRLGNRPQVYAEGILNVCKLYVESPLVCLSGVTGADLKKRIEKIMAKQVARNLSLGGKILLVASAVVAFGGPAAIGVLSVRPGNSQTQTGTVPSAFEVASVKLHEGGISRGDRTQAIEPRKLTWFNTNLGRLIEMAYGVKRYQVSGPDWIVNLGSTDRYDVMATTGKPVAADEIKRMLGPLLAERFHLTFHRETRELPVFGLIVAKGGAKLQPGDDAAPSWTRDSDGGWFHKNWSMTMLADWLSGLASVGRPVIDHTGMQGTYSFHENLLNFPKAGGEETKAEVAARIEQPDDSFFSTLQSTLGLKVQTQKAQIEVLVIDHAERVPTEN